MQTLQNIVEHKDTKISIYVFQKQQQTGEDSSYVNTQAAEPGEGGRPF